MDEEKILLDKYQKEIEKAREIYKSGNITKAIQLFEIAMENIADENDVLDLALIYMEVGDFSKAKELISSIIDDFPDHFRGYYCMGYILDEKEDYEEALKYYNKAFQLEKNNSTITFAIGRMHDQLNNIKEAENFYQLTLELTDDIFWASLNLGSLYERNDNLELALKYTLKALSASSTKAMVNYNLGVIYSKLDQHELALKHYLEETKKEDCFLSTYFNLGILYKDIYKDYENAKYYYLKGLQFDKDNLSLWYNLGCLYAINGNFEDAYQCFLLSLLKNKKVIDGISNDSELVEFRKTTFYQKLLETVLDK